MWNSRNFIDSTFVEEKKTECVVDMRLNELDIVDILRELEI